MALVRANTSGGGNSGTLSYDGYSDYIGATRTATFTITGDHDYIQIISQGISSVSSYVPTYNGVTYNWKKNASNGAGAVSVLIPNVKDGTSITFSDGGITYAGFHGLSYT